MPPVTGVAWIYPWNETSIRANGIEHNFDRQVLYRYCNQAILFILTEDLSWQTITWEQRSNKFTILNCLYVAFSIRMIPVLDFGTGYGSSCKLVVHSNHFQYLVSISNHSAILVEVCKHTVRRILIETNSKIILSKLLPWLRQVHHAFGRWFPCKLRLCVVP